MSGNKVFIPISVLISLYSLSSWINASSLWVELPLMINILPERWSLPSQLAFVIQCSNIAPVMYSIISKIKLGKSDFVASKRDITLSLLIICVSFLASILMAFLWNKTVFVAGVERSIAILCLTGIFSLASCTSSLVYLPFMARFPAAYLSVFYFGLGLSGLLPGLIGLAQGLGSNPTCVNSTVSNVTTCNDLECTYVSNMVPVYPEPRFSIQTFLLIISCILFLSLLSFSALNFTRLKSYQIFHKGSGQSKMKHQKEAVTVASEPLNKGFKFESSEPQTYEADLESIESPASSQSSSKAGLSKAHLCFYLAFILLLNLSTSGLIPATQSYTCLPYGDMVYTLTVRLSSVIGSLSSLSTLVLPVPGIKTIGIFMATGVGIVIFHVTLALLGPHPPMVGTVHGPIIIVITAIIMTSCFSFARVWVASKFHVHGGRKLLVWCGGATQLGSFVGALIAFVLINCFKIFKSIPPCSSQLLSLDKH